MLLQLIDVAYEVLVVIHITDDGDLILSLYFVDRLVDHIEQALWVSDHLLTDNPLSDIAGELNQLEFIAVLKLARNIDERL